jgi:PDZ domain-containing secreted protein
MALRVIDIDKFKSFIGVDFSNKYCFVKNSYTIFHFHGYHYGNSKTYSERANRIDMESFIESAEKYVKKLLAYKKDLEYYGVIKPSDFSKNSIKILIEKIAITKYMQLRDDIQRNKEYDIIYIDKPKNEFLKDIGVEEYKELKKW